MVTPDKIAEVFCLADNFVNFLEKNGLKKNHVGRKSKLSVSEYITLLIIKQHLNIKTNKELYALVKYFMQQMFSKLPSYQQFNDGINKCFPYLIVIMHILIAMNKNKKSRFYVVDSAPLPICSNGHRYNVKIDLGLGKSGKNLNGWYYGFKLHMIINHNMEIVGVKITNAAEKDYNALVGGFIKGLIGWLVGDKGYICKKKAKELSEQGLIMLTRARKNMKKYPATPWTNYLLSRRQSIETVFSMLKLRLNMVSNCARSSRGYFVQVFSSIIAYCFEKNTNTKLLENIDQEELLDMNLIS